MTETTYRSQFGAGLPARVYCVGNGQSRYSVTVVDCTNIEPILAEKAKSCPVGAAPGRGGGGEAGPGCSRADFYGAVTYATYQFLKRDVTLMYLGWSSLNFVEGNMLSLLNHADQSHTSAAIYMHEHHLYILEGTQQKGLPDSGFFQQSITWLDDEGRAIRYQSMYPDGYPVPPIGRGGQQPSPATR